MICDHFQKTSCWVPVNQSEIDVDECGNNLCHVKVLDVPNVTLFMHISMSFHRYLDTLLRDTYNCYICKVYLHNINIRKDMHIFDNVFLVSLTFDTLENLHVGFKGLSYNH